MKFTTRFNKFFPLFLSLFLCAVIFLTMSDYGVTTDERVYFDAGSEYAKWLQNPSIGTIDKYWKINKEHPPLVKVLIGISTYLFHQKLGLFNYILSCRIPILLFVLLLNATLFSFVSRLYGKGIALIVTLSFFLLPRIFFHSHLVTFDYPLATMWFLVICTYWKGMKDQKWIIYSAILLGFALLTKLSALLIYIPIIFYWILSFNDIKNHRLFKIIPMFIISPVVFIAFWPWLWKNTISRIISYFLFHLGHYAIPEYYFGTIYDYPPWHYPLVMTVITIPLITLIPFFVGVFKINTDPHKKTNIFILFNVIFPIFLHSIFKAKYGQTRLFMQVFPFICIISGLGINYTLLYFERINQKKLFLAAYSILFLLNMYVSVIKYYPYTSAYFNEIIGGVDGACSKGFEFHYWGNAYLATIPWLNEHSDSTFWVYYSSPFNTYKRDGLLKRGVKFGRKENSDYLILTSRFGRFNEEMWKYYRYKKPVFSVKLSKVNLVSIYKLEK